MVFPLVAVTWDANFANLDVEILSFDRPGASILPPWGPFCQLGDIRGDHARTHGAQNQMTESTPRVIGVAVGKR